MLKLILQILRAIFAGRPGYGVSWNSIKGWCEYIRKTE